MELKTIIKQFGNSAVIVLTKENLEVYDLAVDDIVNVQIIKEGVKKKER